MNHILAIDTSTDFAGIAVSNGAEVVELRWSAGRNQTTSVLEQIDHCLKLAGIGVGDLAAIAIAIGPGMFNGLRVGASIAKGLAIAGSIPLIGVSTLELAAAPWHGLGRDVIGVVSAGRGRVVWQRFAASPPFAATNEAQNMTLDGLAGALASESGFLAAGEIPPALAETLSGRGVIVRVGDVAGRRPALLAGLGLQRLERGEIDDLATLEPVYLHGQPVPVAE
jgi:tRNA threonylcarbamoyladenosine biosynthesis protein TsaB